MANQTSGIRQKCDFKFIREIFSSFSSSNAHTMRGFRTTDLTLRRGSVRCFTNSLRSPDPWSIAKSFEVIRIFQNLADSFAKRIVTEVEALLVRGDSSGAS
jgi:hypothetical protein